MFSVLELLSIILAAKLSFFSAKYYYSWYPICIKMHKLTCIECHFSFCTDLCNHCNPNIVDISGALFTLRVLVYSNPMWRGRQRCLKYLGFSGYFWLTYFFLEGLNFFFGIFWKPVNVTLRSIVLIKGLTNQNKVPIRIMNVTQWQWHSTCHLVVSFLCHMIPLVTWHWMIYLF